MCVRPYRVAPVRRLGLPFLRGRDAVARECGDRLERQLCGVGELVGEEGVADAQGQDVALAISSTK
jgi:hypothetical protein